MSNSKKTRVYLDEVKQAHTTHWDLDMMPNAELDRLYARNRHRHFRSVLTLGTAAVIACALLVWPLL